MFLLFCFVMLSFMSIDVLWSPAGKGPGERADLLALVCDV